MLTWPCLVKWPPMLTWPRPMAHHQIDVATHADVAVPSELPPDHGGRPCRCVPGDPTPDQGGRPCRCVPGDPTPDQHGPPMLACPAHADHVPPSGQVVPPKLGAHFPVPDDHGPRLFGTRSTGPATLASPCLSGVFSPFWGHIFSTKTARMKKRKQAEND